MPTTTATGPVAVARTSCIRGLKSRPRSQKSWTRCRGLVNIYDAADRVQPAGTDTGVGYDAFGRITTLPTTDTPNGATASIGYYANDQMWSQTSGSTTNSWTLDASSRLNAWTAAGVTHTNHYDDPRSDSPDWTADSSDGNTWTRYITGLDGNVAATINQAGTLTWQIDDLHGDIVAAAVAGNADPTGYYLTDEYGNHEGTGATTGRYDWLGAKQRSHDTPAQLTLMGVRLYNPVLGRFLQTDPIPGGSANNYDYANQDPINNSDLSGRCLLWCDEFTEGHIFGTGSGIRRAKTPHEIGAEGEALLYAELQRQYRGSGWILPQVNINTPYGVRRVDEMVMTDSGQVILYEAKATTRPGNRHRSKEQIQKDDWIQEHYGWRTIERHYHVDKWVYNPRYMS